MERGFGGGQPYGLAAAPQNTTESHSEILFLPDGKTFVRFGPAILLR